MEVNLKEGKFCTDLGFTSTPAPKVGWLPKGRTHRVTIKQGQGSILHLCPEVGTELGKGLEDQEGLKELWGFSLEKKRLGGTFLLSTAP